MMKIFIYLGNIVDAISKAAALVGALLVLPLIGSLTYEVASRFLWGKPTIWAYELTYMFMGTTFLFGMAYALKVRQHVSVDMFYNGMPPRGKAAVDTLCFCILLVALISICNALYQYAIEAYRYKETSGSSGWNPVVWPFRVVWLLGFVALALQTAVETVRSIVVLINGNRTESIK